MADAASTETAGAILAIDPSSSRTGYAVMLPGRELIDGGILTGDMADPPEWRAVAMADDALEVIDEHQPGIVLIETPSPQAPHGKYGNAGQATYGMAVGVIFGRLNALRPAVRIVGVRVDIWTRGCKKSTRARHLALEFPGIVSKRDRGLDMADAVGLAAWWIERRGVMPESKQPPAARRAQSKAVAKSGLFSGV